MRAWIGIRDVNGGLGRESAAIEKSEDGQPAKDHPDDGQVLSTPLVVGRTRLVGHRVAVNGQDG